MSTAISSLKGAALVDFTGTLGKFKQFPTCEGAYVDMVRGANGPKALVIVDRSVGGSLKEPAIVSDHLNLTGFNPLAGPNNPIGERFPVVQGIYIEDVLPSLKRIVIAGVKRGSKITADDAAYLSQFGAQACCYNMVHAMLVAAHAKCRVLGIVLPEGAKLPDSIVQEIESLSGGAK